MANVSLLKKINSFFVLAVISILLSSCGSSKQMEELRLSAIESYNAGDFETAKTRLNEALSMGNGAVGEFQLDLLRYRADCELQLGQYEEAKATYEALLIADDKNKDNAEVYEELVSQLSDIDILDSSNKLMEEGNYQAAYDALSEYASLTDENVIARLAWFNKAVCAEYLGNYGEAYELFNEYLKVYPDDAEAKKEADFLRTR